LLANEAARLERIRAQQIALRETQISEKEVRKKAEELERSQKASEARRIEELERMLKAKDDEVERLRKENESKQADEKRWRQMAEEDQRQREEAEERRSKVKRREEADEQRRGHRLPKERPADIVAPSKLEYDAHLASPPASTASPAKKFGSAGGGTSLPDHRCLPHQQPTADPRLAMHLLAVDQRRAMHLLPRNCLLSNRAVVA
jgi:hypothetical protein